MRTQWQKHVDARLESLERMIGTDRNRKLKPVSAAIEGDDLFIETEAGRVLLNRDSRDWLARMFEDMK